METKSVSKIYTLNKTTYLNLRWIAILGQFFTVNIVKYFFNFEFDILTVNIVIILGSIMYLIEGEKSGYTSIPISIYWAIVTLTTVGYGDIAPITPFGQAVSALIMLIGYSMLAVPTGIITSELSTAKKEEETTYCIVCEAEDLDINSQFCFKCGSVIE